MRRIVEIVIIFVCLGFWTCRRDDDQKDPAFGKVYKIAIILPLSGSDKSAWTNVTDWVTKNIEDAGYVANGKIQLVWFDLNKNDVVEIAKIICKDTTICAAVGPYSSSESFKIAPLFIEAQKPLILPTSTSADISAAFSGKKYIWRLPESDISQCQALLVIAKNKGAKKVALITGDDPYGLTFYNWFGFQATEMDLEVTAVEKYDQSVEQPDMYMDKILAGNPDMIIAVARSLNQAVAMVKYWRNRNSDAKILFSDGAYIQGFIDELGDLAEGIEGTAFTSNPATGFNIAYKEKYNTNPTLGMSQLYDAILLLAYSLELSGGKSGLALATGLMELSDGEQSPTFWDKDGIKRALERLRSGQRPKILGASGPLKFAAGCYTDNINSTYLQWQVYKRQFLNLNYYRSDATGRISNLAAAWQSYSNKTQSFENIIQNNLPARHELWAMIVATSQGWSNYRHQADALRIYHLLKSQGIDDQHIIFCMADDIANNSRNPNKNIIVDAITSENLYHDFTLDYKIQDISNQDLMNILSGNSSSRLQQVIRSDENDNILVYMIGHGESNGMVVQSNTKQYLVPSQLKNTLSEMYTNKKYRQILICIEACYSGIFQDSEGVPSSLIITAANRFESSKTVVYDPEVEVWLSDQFTNEWLKLMLRNKNISFSEMYLNLCKSVYGSHVCIYNASNYGSVYENSIEEFLIP